MKSNRQVQAAAEGMPKSNLNTDERNAIDDVSLMVSDACGFAQVLYHLVDDLFAHGRQHRTDPRTGCLMIELHEADMLIFIAGQTKWAAEGADEAFLELGH